MRSLWLLTLVPAVLSLPAQQQPLTAEAIMAKVATNQDHAEAARRQYVYVQHARVVSRKGHTVRCEETTESRITPAENGTHADLIKLDGKLLHAGKYIIYTHLPDTKHNGNQSETSSDSITIDSENDMDRDLVENMRGNLTRDDKSKDGIDTRLFPLSSKDQSDYLFRLVGQEHLNDRDVFHVIFQPKVKDDFGWKGDAYIDTESFQPVIVRTEMSRKVPFAVRTLLGTNVPGLGFTVVYAPQPDGVWFPVSFGTEFKLHVLFFFSRDITINAVNRDFEKTHSDARLLPTQ